MTAYCWMTETSLSPLVNVVVVVVVGVGVVVVVVVEEVTVVVEVRTFTELFGFNDENAHVIQCTKAWRGEGVGRGFRFLPSVLSIRVFLDG